MAARNHFMAATKTTIKYDDFGEVIWKEPPKIRRKKKSFMDVFKQLGEALI